MTRMTAFPDDEWVAVAFAAEIRAEMGRRQITGRELARRLGKHHQWVQYRVNGTNPLAVHEIPPFARALGLTPVELAQLLIRILSDPGQNP